MQIQAARWSAYAALLCGFAVPSLYGANYVYVNNSVTPNTVSAFSVAANGALTPVAGSPFQTGGSASACYFAANRIDSVTVNARLYVSNTSSNTVSAFDINPATGALTPIAGSPFATGGSLGCSGSLSADGAGKYLAVSNSGNSTIAIMAINPSTGALTHVAGSPFGTGTFGNIDALAMAPNGKFVAGADPSGRLYVFQVGAGGALTAAPGSPFSANFPTGVDIDCSGTRLALGGSSISLYSIAGNGSVALLSNGSSSNPQSVAFSANDQFVYGNGGGSGVWGFKINGNSLTAVPGSPNSGSGGPTPLAPSGDGQFLYVSEAQGIAVYSIAATGALTRVSSATVSGFYVAPAAYPGKSCGDVAAPATMLGAAPAANGAGWNNTNVTLTLSSTDASGVQSISYSLAGAQTTASLVTTGGSSAQVTIAAEGTTTITYFATDSLGNQESPKTYTVKIDKTAPGIALVSRTPANAAGWNNTNVTVTWSCSDALSGATASGVTQTVTTEGQNLSATGACSDVAGNQASDTLSGIKLDRTPPGIVFGAPSPAPNASGWNNTDVAIPFTASDNLSGVTPNSPSSPALISTEGAGVKATVTLTDVAGNTATYTSAAVNIDKTAPVVTGSRAPAANAAGWNNTDVTVSFACTDALSGVASSPSGQTLTIEGANLSATGNCTDRAGNTASATVSGIKIDKTAPAITGMPTSCSIWPPNHKLVLVATIAANDGASSVSSFGVTGTSNEADNGLGDGDQPNDIVISGGAVQLRAERSALGSGRVYTVKATATDQAGNSATATAACTVPLNQK